MASNSLTPFGDAGVQYNFELQSSSGTKTVWIRPGRSISLPHSISIERKPSAPNSASNDHVILRVTRVEMNTGSGKFATLQATLDISIPKDSIAISQGTQKDQLSILASVLNEFTAMETTNVNITKLIEGRDL